MIEAVPKVDALESRVTRLEEAISNGLTRIEDLLRQSIGDLKAEQIKDLKDNYLRLADDQRRLWDAVRVLEKAKSRNDGGMQVVGLIWNVVSACIGGGIVGVLNWLGRAH